MNKDIPRGLVFSFSSPQRKRRAYKLTFMLFLVQIGLIWPVYPMFSSPTPQILGFPLSFSWVILLLIISFTSLLIFFRMDTSEEN